PWTNEKQKGSRNMKKEQTRPEFLKYSGTIVLLLGSAWYVPVNKKSADPKAPKAPVKLSSRIPASDGYLLVDMKKCQGWEFWGHHTFSVN
ncbi:MAG: hypothetical protein ACETWD_06740, partial [Desulfatiglandales bacterium]